MLLLPHQDPPSLFSATSPNYKDYVGLLIQDKKRLWFKEEASGSCKKVHAVTSRVCRAFCSRVAGELKSPTTPPQGSPTAAPVVNPTTSSYHRVHPQMRVDGLCPTHLIGQGTSLQ